jgi:aspartate/methionine/tyrosine aminotransferase
MVGKLKQRRDFVVKRIRSIPGLSVAMPRGAFYAFSKVDLNGTKWTDDSEFITDLLKETGVLVVNGSGFDPVRGSGHFRSVFLPDEQMLGEAFDAIENFLRNHS